MTTYSIGRMRLKMLLMNFDTHADGLNALLTLSLVHVHNLKDWKMQRPNWQFEQSLLCLRNTFLYQASCTKLGNRTFRLFCRLRVHTASDFNGLLCLCNLVWKPKVIVFSNDTRRKKSTWFRWRYLLVRYYVNMKMLKSVLLSTLISRLSISRLFI